MNGGFGVFVPNLAGNDMSDDQFMIAPGRENVSESAFHPGDGVLQDDCAVLIGFDGPHA